MQNNRKRKLCYEHPLPLVKQLLDLTDGEKDYLLMEKAKLSHSYLSQLRHARYSDPGVKGIIRLAGALGYDLVLLKREEE